MGLRFMAMAGMICGAGQVCAQDVIAVPSGQPITYVETIPDAQGADGLTYRFRFLAPDIAREGGKISSDVAQEDMKTLCETFALSHLTGTGPQVAQIIISLSDRPIPFGEPDPDATQYFEAFHPEGDACIWDGF